MIRLIGFNGGMGSGKSTAIEFLKAQYPDQEIVNVKFAGPLYEIQEFIYKRIESVYKRPPTFVKDRKLLQWIGTDWGRDTISQNLWVDIWRAEVNDALKRGCLVVCDDVRFDNEAALVRAMGGRVIQLQCNKTHERIDTAAGIVNHKSEAGIAVEFIDAVVLNDGTLEDFKVSLTEVFNHFGVGFSE
jgi:hypothetical protein